MIAGWRDWPRGLAVLAGLVAADLGRGRPPRLSTAERLAMLPTEALPVRARVTVRWDDHQIPFIEAGSDRDLAVALGVVHAHLRLGQIEVARRIAQGRIAEMIGPLGIEPDRAIRLLELDRAVPELAARLPPASRDWAEGFVAGLNHHLEHAPVLPREFAVLALRPEPWTLDHLLLLLRLNSADISWLVWARLLRLRGRLPPARWAALWPRLLSGGAPPAMDGQDGGMAGGMGGGAVARALAAAARGGSNSVAVSGALTATGAALIASDPHLPFGLPSPCLIVGMRAPGLHCVGMMMPGLPTLVLGRNPDAAWGATSLHAQGSDLFDVSGLAPAEFAVRHQTIRVRGGAPRRLALRRTAHGPVVSDGPLLPSRRPLALRWMGHRPSDELTALLSVARCRDWAGFRAAMEGFGVPGLNMLFAGRDGQAGHLLAAHLPCRPAAPPGDLPVPPAAAAAWQDVVRASGLPVRAAPEHPLLVSANDAPAGSGVPVGLFFSEPDRRLRIEALLSRHPVDLEALAAMQADVLAPRSLALRDLLLGRLPSGPRSRRLRRFLAVLSEWDGRYGSGSEGALAFELLLGGVVRRLRARSWTPRLEAYEAVWMTQTLLAEDLRALPARRLRRLVAAALVPAARRQDRYRDWGGLHRIAPTHPLGRLPLIGARYRARPFAAAGGNHTVHKSAHPIGTRPHGSSFGSCARHLSDLSDPDANLMVLLGGQDGWFGSENFDDLSPLFRRGDYVRVPLGTAAVRERHRRVTVLVPARPPAVEGPTGTMR